MRLAQKSILVTVMTILLAVNGLWSYVFIDNFSSGANWITNLKYNIQQGVWTNLYTGASITNWYVSGGKLHVGSSGSNIGTPVAYNTSFYGAYTLFTNTNFSASKKNPFGYEITRIYLHLYKGNASFIAGTMDFSIVQAKAGVTNGATTTGIEGTKFDQYVNLSEIDWENKSTTTYFNWNQSSMPASKIPVTSVTDASGSVGNLQSILEWNHTAATNTNYIRFRIVNDGEMVYWYANPNPYNHNTGPTNAFYLIDKQPVAFSNNLQPMFGIGSLTFGGVYPETAELSNFTIRSVCSNLASELSPVEMKAGANAPIYLVIRPLFLTNEEAGVGEFSVELPNDYTNFTNWTAFTNTISVHWVSTNGIIFKNFTNQFGDSNPTNTGFVRISLKDNKKTLKVRFFATNVIASGDVFHPFKWGGNANSNAILLIVSNFLTTNIADSSGKTFRITVNNEKYSDTTWTNNATSGPMESYAGDAIDMSLITNTLQNTSTLTFKTYNSPVGYSGITPNRVYEGVETVYQCDIAAANPDNNANITKATIYVPAGFGVDTNLLYSEKMYESNGTYLYVTNLGGGTNAVIADYGKKGVYLPANGGWDTVTIKCTNTTNVPDGSSGVTVYWRAQVYSSLTLNATNTLTNAYYPSQGLLVRKKPPVGTVAVTPNEVSNTVESNSFEIVIKNTATEDPNRLKLVRVRLPGMFTNVLSAVSASNGVVTSIVTNAGSNWLVVSYTNVPPNTYIPANGGYDVIRVVLADNVGSLSDITNGTVKAEGDNLNGDGFIMLAEDTAGDWDVKFYTPMANAYAHIDNPGPEGGVGSEHNIYTDMDVETNLALILENKGEEGNHISMARIVFPVGITNVTYVGDTKLAIPTLTIEYTNVGAGVTNTNWVLYLSYTNTLKTKIGAVLAEQDYINLKIWDAIDSPSNAHIEVYVKNVKTNYSAATEVPDTTMLTYIYPPLNAKGSVSVAGGFIDWSTMSNVVEYTITNQGRTKNEILQAQIMIPTDISTSVPVTSITSTLVTNTGAITFNSGVITVNYGGGNGYKFAGGLQDKISFLLIDDVTGTVTARLTNTVTNSRTKEILAEMSTNSQNLYFQTPPVMGTYRVGPSVVFAQTNGGVETNAIVLTMTNYGSGNNNIKMVKITAPFTTAKVAEIHDAVMGTNWTQAPTWVGMSGNIITLYYTNSATNFAAGTVETVTVYLKNDYTNEQDLGWSVTADNDLADGVGFTNLGVMTGYTNRTYVVERGQVYADPNTVVTATYSNYIRYSLKNGTVGDSTGRPIYHAKIVIADPFTNVSSVSMEQAGSYTVTNIDSTTMWVLVDYTGGLQAGEADNVRFWLSDSWYVGTNYVNIASQVDYEDGGGWRDTAVESGKSTGVEFTFPPASATGYILSGEWVPEDFTNYTYQFYLKNTGESGNDIKLVKITPPSVITNITSVTCLTKQLGGTYDGTNVWINYAGAGKLLSSLETDTVQLVGYDNVAGGNVYSAWGVKVANTTTNDESYRIDITVPGNKSVSNIIYHPTVKTSTYLEAVNAIDGAETNKNKVWTTKTSNTFNYYIYNQSDSGNNVTKARIFIPGGAGFFDTNSLQVTNAKGGAVYLTNNRTEIWVVYAGPLVPGDFDTVQIKVNDLYNYGETNLEWTNDTAYDTTDGVFKASLEYTGKSRRSYFLMPNPSAKAGIMNPVPREVYVKATNFTIGYAVTNTGEGTSDLFSVTLTIPAPFRAQFDTNAVSNSLATNRTYDGGTGELTLYYATNFKPGTNDRIYLNMRTAPGTLTVTNYSIGCQVSNYSYGGTAGDTAVNGKVLSIVNVPTYYVTPTSLSTTATTNDVNVFLLNNTGGQAKLKKVVLGFSAPFTNIIQTNSLVITNLGHIMGMITSLTLDYASDLNEISVGGNDAVTFRLADDFEIGDMTAYVTAKGYNGFEWVEMDRDVGGGTNVSFVMPSADATAKINYTQMYTTAGETNIALSVINKGTGSNKLSRLKVTIPGGLTNVVVLSNQVYLDAVTAISNGTVYVEYQNTNLFASGVTDVIWLGFSNQIVTGTNVTFALEGVNLTNGAIDSRYVTVPGEGGAGALNLRVDYPAVSVQGYINGRSQFFTINTNDKVEYRIVNGSINTMLTNAKIYYDTNLFRVTGVSNTWTNSTWATNGDYLEIVYNGTGIQFSQRDILTIRMGYNITNVTSTMLTSRVVLVTNGAAGVFDTVDAGYTQRLDVTVASWGKIKGWVSPTNFTVTAKLYNPGTSVIATNIDGGLASTVTITNGEYAFTFIPNGTYTLELSAAMFRTYQTTVTVESNMENLVSVVTMQNALLTPDASTNQTVLCYDDNKTKVVFPSSTIARDLSININLVDLTQPQKDDLNVNSNVTAPSDTTGLKGYRFDVRNLGNSLMEGEVLKLDATLYLSYDATNVAARGWNEDNLAIYYWDRVTSKWVKVGGTVDKTGRYVTAKVSYVHDLYGVFGGKTGDGVIKNVVVRPRIFTPTKSANGYFGSVRITFELDTLQAPDGYDVKIYDMRGSLVKSFSRKGTYSQGEVAWDSKDDEGYPVKGGVYIYRVLAGGKSYSGVIVIVR